ncbi:MAG: hypothetical protein U0975_10610 [Erythrobacter sp.]|nr:hypothetical protein [Xanthomonadaceae bacterium]MDP2184904.1 hypothetical protein [Xanthomonadales bacterium]MDZ4116911.1 hypothetical protein [Xanthomonadaceae bacterium]MDZ4273114.1 hypothetical protein [Erythrobacter sp.]
MQGLKSLDLGRNVLRFNVVEGVIVGDKKWAETHVYSSGGGGYIGPQGGYVRPPTLNSNVSTNHEIWIKENGSEREFPISLRNTDLKVREGHKVAVVIADTGQHRYFTQLVNRTTRQVFPLFGNLQNFVIEAAKLNRVGFFGAAAFLVLLSIVIGIAASNAYSIPQKKIEESNNLIRAKAINVDYYKYPTSRSSEIERQQLERDFEGKYQAKLLGVSPEQFRKMRTISIKTGLVDRLLEKKAFDQLGIVVPRHYFSYPENPKMPKLSPAQENSLYQLWYGHPNIYNQMKNYDKEYREHSDQIGFAVGGVLGLIGVLLAFYRVIRFFRILKEAEIKVQSHFEQLANSLK